MGDDETPKPGRLREQLLNGIVPPELAEANDILNLGVTFTYSDYANMPARLYDDLQILAEVQRVKTNPTHTKEAAEYSRRFTEWQQAQN